MNNLDQFKRSINIWKITEGEYIDNYVDMYLLIVRIFGNLKESEYSNYLNKKYTNSIGEIMVEVNEHFGYIWIPEETYTEFKNKFVISYVIYVELIQEYLTTELGLPKYLVSTW